MTTSSTASNSVFTTSRMDSLTNTVGSYTIWYSIPSGKFWDSSAMVVRTRSASRSALPPGSRNTAMGTAGTRSRPERRP